MKSAAKVYIENQTAIIRGSKSEIKAAKLLINQKIAIAKKGYKHATKIIMLLNVYNFKNPIATFNEYKGFIPTIQTS